MQAAYCYIGSLNVNDYVTWVLEELAEAQPERKVVWAGEGSPTREGRFPTSDVAQNKRITLRLTCDPGMNAATTSATTQAARSALFQQLARAEDPNDSLMLQYRPASDDSWTEVRSIRILSVGRMTPQDGRAWAGKIVRPQIELECEPAWRGTLQTLEALVIGGSFEVDANADGVADFWAAVGTPAATAMNTANKKYGLSSQRITTNATGTTEGIKSDNITVVASTVYTIAASVLLDSGSPVTMRVYDNNHTAYLADTVTWSTTGSAFVEKTLTFTTPSGTTSIYIEISRLSTGSLATIFYVDGVYMEQRSDSPPARLFQHFDQLAPDVITTAMWSSFSLNGVLGDLPPLYNFAVENLSGNVYNDLLVSTIRLAATQTYTPLSLCYDLGGAQADAGSIANLVKRTAITVGAGYANCGTFSVSTETKQRPYQCFIKIRAAPSSSYWGNTFYIKGTAADGAVVIPEKQITISSANTWYLIQLSVVDWPPQKEDQTIAASESATITIQVKSDTVSANIDMDYVLFFPADGFFWIRDTGNFWKASGGNSRLRVGNITFLRPVASGYLYSPVSPELRGYPQLWQGENVGYLWIDRTAVVDAGGDEDAENACHGVSTSTYDRRYRIKILYYPRYL